ncbi:hypothetical protein D7I43_30710 [Micromonospora globbae]|uniref:Uncharacterized protein n=1 Tax=Micromonospora globbae TaxID=1894969 RepID=A0A420EQH4_9ACTN|nr:hypothetical protein D7I43_30710 [Micromonospora globbae]
MQMTVVSAGSSSPIARGWACSHASHTASGGEVVSVPSLMLMTFCTRVCAVTWPQPSQAR